MLNSVPVAAHTGPADHEPFQMDTEQARIIAHSKFLRSDGLVNLDFYDYSAIGVHDGVC